MRKLAAFFAALSLLGLVGCTQPKATTPSKAGPKPVLKETTPAEKPAEKPADKPAEKPAEKPADKTPPK